MLICRARRPERAVAAALALTTSFFALMSPAQAQTVCTTPLLGTLNCADPTATVAGTITSGATVLAGPGLNATSASDLTVNLIGNVTTGGPNEPAIVLTAVDDLIFTSDGIISTLGLNSDAVNLTGTTVNADLGTLTTQGVNSQGLQILSTNGPITADVDAIRTDGDLSSATVLRGTGDINLSARALSTNGTDAIAIDISSDPAACILLGAGGCDVTAIADSVTTNGFGGIGALISATGDTNVNIGVLRTGGDQAAGLDLTADPVVCAVLGVGACDTSFTVGNLTTTGNDSPGAIVRGAGDITANVAVLQTNGDRAIGLDLANSPDACIILGAGACDTSFTVGTLTTQGDGATGLLVRAAGDTTGSVNILETNGDGATGIDIASDPAACIIVGVGACNVGLTANQVTTRGNDSGAVLINAIGDITTNFGVITTSGDGSPGVFLVTDPVLCAAIGPGSCVINSTSGPVTTGGDDSPGTVVRGGEDPITVVVGPTTTVGDNSPGVDVAGTGPITVTAGPTSTSGDNSAGIIIAGDNDPVTLNCGSVTTTGINSPAVAVEGTGTITVRCGALQTTGGGSDGLQIVGGAGPIDAIITSAVTRGPDSDGVQVSGTGAITLNTGNVTTGGDGSTGVLVDGGSGPIALLCGNVVTTGPNSPGVDVSGSGTINVNCQSVTTSGINSDGINVDGGAGAVTVTTGPVITRGVNSHGIDVATTTGAQLITANGVNVSGVGVNAIEATATGCADISINATNDIISTGGTAVLASTLCSVTIITQPGATVAGAVAGINATSGTGTTITLNDSVSSSAGPAIDVNGAAAVVNINAAGSVAGRIDLTDADDTVNNAGLFTALGTSNFGGGTDVFNNLATGVVNGASGTGVLAGCETFNNAGTITMVNGTADNTLSLCGNYVGTGGANLRIDVGTSAGGLISDRLIIGANASGSTVINTSLLSAPVIDPDGVLVVDAASATGTPFTLGGQTNFGLINLGLRQTGGDTFLVATPDLAAIEPIVVGNLAQNLWYQSADIYSNYSALRRTDLGGDRRNGLGLWGQVYYSVDKSDRQQFTAFGNDFSVDRFKTKRRGVQAGVDYLLGANAVVGITGGYERAEADIRSSASDFRASGYNIGGYAIFGAGYGFYGDALVKYDRAKLRFDNPLFDDVVGNPRLRSLGAQGQVGYRFGTDALNFDLGAGLAVVRSKIDDVSVGTIDFDYDRVKSTRAHLGARATFGGGAFSPFVDAKVYHEFNGDTRLALISGTAFDAVVSKGRGTWGRVEAGIGAQNGSGPILAAWGDFGDVKGFGAKAGWRFGGAREASVPLPPPPPPPLSTPAPVTQTCADGSVVLATDLCPSPPPPLPPAPEAAPERG